MYLRGLLFLRLVISPTLLFPYALKFIIEELSYLARSEVLCD